MKKRRELLQAMKEDTRITSLEGLLQRKTSEVETYRRIATREATTPRSGRQCDPADAFADAAAGQGASASASAGRAGSAQHNNNKEVDQLQQLLREEQLHTKRAAAELASTRLEATQQRLALEQQTKKVSRLQGEVEAFRTVLQQTESEASEAKAQSVAEGRELEASLLGEASRAKEQRVVQLEGELRLAQLASNKAERDLGRADRRALRAEQEADELRERLAHLSREQRVKDAQLESMRGDIQDMLASGPVEGKQGDGCDSDDAATRRRRRGGARDAGGEDDEGDEGSGDGGDFADVLEAELASMRGSYEEKVRMLQEKVDEQHRELRAFRDA